MNYKNYKYVIIGGGIAGTTAAETIRQNDADGTVAIVSNEPYRLYSRIMLSKPNFFLEKIPFEQVWLKQEEWYPKNRVELIAGRQAVKLDAKNKTVALDDGDVLQYEKLLLAIGGYARPWALEGADKSGIFYLRTLDDAKGVISSVKSAKSAIAVGGGFISFEMCDMMRLAGLDVSLVLRESHYWEPILDETSGKIIEAALEKGGVKIYKNAEVKKILGEDAVSGVVLGDGTEISAQMLIVGIGVYCPFAWVQESGITVNRGIVTDEFLETSAKDVLVAGDAAEFNDLILGEKIQLGNWVNAQVQGRIAALNMVGKKQPFRLVSFYTTQGLGITIAFAGDVRPAKDTAVFTRGSAELGSYGRIIVKDGEIIGTTLINRTQELGAISKLIEKDFKVSGREKRTL